MPSNADHTPNDENDLVDVAALGAAQGLDGEMRLQPLMRNIDETARLLEAAGDIWIGPGPGGRPRALYRIEYLREQGKRLLIKIEGVDSRSRAEELFTPAMPLSVSLEAAADGLEEGEFFSEELTGCICVDPEGRTVGIVRDVETGPQDLLVIEADGDWLRSRGGSPGERPKRFLLPFIDPLVPEVDLSEQRVVVLVPVGIENL